MDTAGLLSERPVLDRGGTPQGDPRVLHTRQPDRRSPHTDHDIAFLQEPLSPTVCQLLGDASVSPSLNGEQFSTFLQSC